MKIIRILPMLALMGALPFTAFADTPTPTSVAEKATLLRSQDAIKEYATTLKAALQAAMKAGGPIAAIPVCHTEAPMIAKEVSAKYAVDIYRTSLKPRAKPPAAWETVVLKQFAAEKMQGTPVANIVWHTTIEENGQPTLRLMKAIATDEICLKCHGTDIAPAVMQKIRSLYPKDEAIGYQAGDIRGAFSVTAAIHP